MLVNRTCQICGRIFLARLYDINRGWGKFCSNSCKSKYARSLQDIRGDKNPHWKGGIWKNPDEYKKLRKLWAKNNPLAKKAHHSVQQAIKTGKLKKECCSNCGKSVNVVAHHNDYTKPLEVMWLCQSCHLKLHRSKTATPRPPD